jgi:hypothetical protein
MAGEIGPQGLPTFLVACSGRPAVRRGRLVALAVLALRVLHDDRQILALLDHDGGIVVGLSRKHHRLAESALRSAVGDFHHFHEMQTHYSQMLAQGVSTIGKALWQSQPHGPLFQCV